MLIYITLVTCFQLNQQNKTHHMVKNLCRFTMCFLYFDIRHNLSLQYDTNIYTHVIYELDSTARDPLLSLLSSLWVSERLMSCIQSLVFKGLLSRLN